MATDNAPKSGAGGFLTKKAGPLPVWGWIAVAVVGYYLYKRYTGSSSSSSTGATTGNTTATGVPDETLTLPNGESYTGPVGYGPPGQGGSTPGNTKTTTTGTTKTTGYQEPTGEKLVGSGYGTPKGTNVVSAAGGGQYEEISGAALAALPKGTEVYYQEAQGIFSGHKYGSDANLKKGTPEFVKVP